MINEDLWLSDDQLMELVRELPGDLERAMGAGIFRGASRVIRELRILSEVGGIRRVRIKYDSVSGVETRSVVGEFTHYNRRDPSLFIVRSCIFKVTQDGDTVNARVNLSNHGQHWSAWYTVFSLTDGRVTFPFHLDMLLIRTEEACILREEFPREVPSGPREVPSDPPGPPLEVYACRVVEMVTPRTQTEVDNTLVVFDVVRGAFAVFIDRKGVDVIKGLWGDELDRLLHDPCSMEDSTVLVGYTGIPELPDSRLVAVARLECKSRFMDELGFCPIVTIDALARRKSINDLCSIHVVPDLRGQGIGTTLLKATVALFGDAKNVLTANANNVFDCAIMKRPKKSAIMSRRLADWFKRCGFRFRTTSRSILCTEKVGLIEWTLTALRMSAMIAWIVSERFC
jgi:GNAT superfamily N-acetyltransferase